MPKRPSVKPQLSCVCALALLLLFSVCPAEAADFILHLKNGDRLTGAIQSETPTNLVLQTKSFGAVKIPLAEIKKREAIVPLPTEDPLLTANTVATNTPPAAPPKTNIVAAPTLPPAPVKVEGPKNWNVDLQFGLNLRYSAREQREMLAIGKYTYATNGFRQAFDYNFTYGRTDGIESANRMNGSSKTEWDLSPKWYLFGLAGAGYDDVRRIELQWELSPGLGYQWIKKSDYVLKTEFGLSYQEQHFTAGNDIDTYGARLAAIFTWRIWDKLVADGRAEFFPSFSEFGDYRVRLESTLKYPLRKNVSLNLIVIDLYDSKSAPGVENNDLQIRSALGVKF
jgi:hypothetical protein